jgi:2-oxo-4-hydroxy-4-carboxy-5-ureidoimidazoline decarboxylase
MNLAALNQMPVANAQEELLRCCGSQVWAKRVAGERPYRDHTHLEERADAIWLSLSREDWLEAFSHHPRIGEKALREKFAATAGWATDEQKGTSAAGEEVLRALAEGNRAYDEKFGHVFLICASGKSADEMLAALRARLPNSAERELEIAAQEQMKITRIRLKKLLEMKP